MQKTTGRLAVALRPRQKSFSKAEEVAVGSCALSASIPFLVALRLVCIACVSPAVVQSIHCLPCSDHDTATCQLSKARHISVYFRCDPISCVHCCEAKQNRPESLRTSCSICQIWQQCHVVDSACLGHLALAATDPSDDIFVCTAAILSSTCTVFIRKARSGIALHTDSAVNACYAQPSETQRMFTQLSSLKGVNWSTQSSYISCSNW